MRAVMIFPGQAQVGVEMYSVYVCLSVGMDGKKRARAVWCHFLESSVIRH